jgi:hypothetical protein
LNADLARIRDSKLFSKLPDRAFNRIVEHIRVRAYENGDEILNFQKLSEFSQSYGYVVSGHVLFVNESSKPVGIATKDEFFLGRPFSLNNSPVDRLLAASDGTFVVFVPRNVIMLLTQASETFSDIIEEIYDSIFERAKVVQSDSKAQEKVQGWISNPEASKTIATWVATIEKRRADARLRKAKDKRARKKIIGVWVVGMIACLLAFIECMSRLLHLKFSFVYFIDPDLKLDAYKPGSSFNIGIGIVGYTLVLLTNLHTFNKWAIRKWKWKVNYQFSQELHMFFGFLGFLFILLHSAFQLKGINVADIAIYACFIVVMSGLVGQFISNQIPKTIRGEMIKLEQLREEQAKLKEKATLLMNDPSLYKTSIHLMSQQEPKSAAATFLLAPLYWIRARKLRNTLENLGLSEQSAHLASHYVLHEVRLRHRIRFLEISNVFFKRWVNVHKIFGYSLYVLATIHVIIVSI